MMKDRLLKEFKRLALIDGASKNERKVADYIKTALKKCGYKVNEDNTGRFIGGNSGNLIVKIEGKVRSFSPLLFLAHMDTISPTKDLKIVVNGDLVKSDGKTILGADNRGAAAVMIEVLKNLKRLGGRHSDLYFIFTVAEEIGLLGAKHLNLKNVKDGWGFILDSGRAVGHIVNQSPYLDKFTITCLGKAAHAGVCPEYGVNAISFSCDAISKIKTGRIDEVTTLNFGKIKGGKAVNIIPDEVVIHGETRSHSLQKLINVRDKVCETFKKTAKKYGGKVEFKHERDFDGFKVDEKSNILKYIKKCLDGLGMEAEVLKGGGGSDANVLNKHGITSVVLGSGYEDAHSERERIKVSELAKLYNLIFKLIQESVNGNK